MILISKHDPVFTKLQIFSYPANFELQKITKLPLILQSLNFLSFLYIKPLIKMPETIRLPFKNRALGHKDQKLWKKGVFLGGTRTSQYFVEKTRKSFSKIKILSRGQLLDTYDGIQLKKIEHLEIILIFISITKLA